MHPHKEEQRIEKCSRGQGKACFCCQTEISRCTSTERTASCHSSCKAKGHLAGAQDPGNPTS